MKILLIMLAVILPALGRAGPVREYPVYQLKSEPVVDGNLEEDVWAEIPEAGGFYIHDTGSYSENRYALVKPTRFKAGWTKDSLFMAVYCAETAPDKLTDNGVLWANDSMEMFFYPAKSDYYVQLLVNARGRRGNGKVFPQRQSDGGGTQTAWEWTAKTQVGKESWTLEARIPFKVLGNPPVEGEKWRVNVARNLLTGPANERCTCWPDLSAGKKGFHSLDQFGVFVFRGNELSAGAVERLERDVNQDYLAFLQGRIMDLARMGDKFQAGIEDGLRREKLREQAENLKMLWDWVGQSAKNPKARWQDLSQGYGKCWDLNDRSLGFNAKVNLESLFDTP